MNDRDAIPNLVMDPRSLCPQCGAPLDAFAPRGRCLRCLFSLALEFEPAPDTASSPMDDAGTPFGNFVLHEEIGRGGMGVVYKAWQHSLHRWVAVKVLSLGAMSSPEAIRRFRTEAAASGALHHPHIVAVHEVGLHQGQHFIAMEWVDGPNLAALDRAIPSRRH
ncbi:MAG: hypothetical protein FJ404_01320 [Verrucomicrobia bacterium]|nr:hypothetical protein [Verrucomicrobiota bacterium]